MINLFKNKPKVYEVKSSEREVYETQSFYRVTVVDETGKFENEIAKSGKSLDEALDYLYEGLKSLGIATAMGEIFTDDRCNVHIKITDSSARNARIVEVRITKRRVWERIKDCLATYLDDM